LRALFKDDIDFDDADDDVAAAADDDIEFVLMVRFLRSGSTRVVELLLRLVEVVLAIQQRKTENVENSECRPNELRFVVAETQTFLACSKSVFSKMVRFDIYLCNLFTFQYIDHLIICHDSRFLSLGFLCFLLCV
jgi:hypothetical protein